ncbi:MAG: hypothetical protein J0L78_14705 [Planctomycetes bacterium]|nr:hypothetical protein [Planctomycetota bacterium]
MLKLLFAVGFTAWTAFGSAVAQIAPARFDRQVVVSVFPRGAADIEFMDFISSDRWTCGPGGPNSEADYRISNDQVPELQRRGIPFRVAIPDVQALLDREQAAMKHAARDAGVFGSFPTYAQTGAFIDSLVANHPTLATRLNLGNSLEGRQIFGVRVTGTAPGVGDSGRKPAIVLQSLQHAREWAGLTSNLYTVNWLLENYQSDTTVRRLLDEYEIYVVPIVNPDGYEITWTWYRYWRKNARVQTPPGYVVGVDLNRNWSVGYGLNSGSSASYNSETYRGPSAFSEPETRVMRDFILSLPKLAAFVDIHTYAGKVLRPWAYQWQTPPGYFGLMRVGQAMVDSVQSGTGIRYFVGGPEILYLASGVAPDWAYGTTGAVSFTIEMQSEYGFSPGPETIVQSGEECRLAILAMLRSLCRADFNLDNVVDDADFVLFLNAYSALLSNGGDLSGDGKTDDADFSLFAPAYDSLTCP